MGALGVADVGHGDYIGIGCGYRLRAGILEQVRSLVGAAPLAWVWSLAMSKQQSLDSILAIEHLLTDEEKPFATRFASGLQTGSCLS